MKFLPQRIPEVILIEPTIFSDNRGYFMEMWQQKKFAEAGIDVNLVQDNLSYSNGQVLRGLHYQIQQPQGKLIKVLAGKIFDVAVDIRKDSPTFGQHVSAILSSENRHQLWVPPGFAHGFLVMSPEAEVLYSCGDFYAPQFERTIIWSDPSLNIPWPLAANEVPVLSGKDAEGKLLIDAELF